MIARTRPLKISLCLSMIAIAALDVLAGAQVSPWALYAVPIGLGAVVLGSRFGLGLALACGGLLLAAAWLGGHPFDSWWHFALSVSNRLACLLAIAVLAAAAARSKAELDNVPGTGIGNY